MPYDEPEPDDPTLLVGVTLPADPESDLDMAYVFAEEFARLGFDEERLLRLFRQPFYAGAHRLWEALGEARIRGVIRETLALWGGFRCVDRDAAPPAGAQDACVRGAQAVPDGAAGDPGGRA
jgi:hypothetical protein